LRFSFHPCYYISTPLALLQILEELFISFDNWGSPQLWEESSTLDNFGLPPIRRLAFHSKKQGDLDAFEILAFSWVADRTEPPELEGAIHGSFPWRKSLLRIIDDLRPVHFYEHTCRSKDNGA